ncbi:MAG: mandelate racemase/muconate lactonizing enzyme family protein [Candidatus Acidiferrales bacterium]|jgi:L-alanine-DL-glutamate epimerase-like enolase superfamily enzyme
MERRSFLKSLAVVSAASLAWPRLTSASLPKAKITRVRIYLPPRLNQTFNQSDMIVTIETDAGLTGIGEGGVKDTLEQCASSLIGENPFQIEKLWQKMYSDRFYPPGREKIHAQGALDLALWDIKGKALGLPVHEILGGTVRNYCECYQTSGPSAADKTTSLKDRAAKAMADGYRCYRVDASISPTVGTPIVNDVYNTHQRVHEVVAACKEIREGVGPNGDWALDLHQKFDYPDAVRCCKLIEDYEPYFVEDPVRDEQFHQDIPRLRQMTTVPLTAGEEWGQRWDFNTLVENHDLDYVRVTLPNVGGITEMVKILALCETHAIGIIPHFTGPLSTASLVNVLSTYSKPVLFEYNYGDRVIPHLPQCMDFKNGKLYTNDRPGLGVTADMAQLKMISEVTTPNSSTRLYTRPDGSLTHW